MSTAKRIFQLLFVSALSLTSFSTSAAAQDEVCFDVALQGGATNVCADVHDNPRALPFGATVLALHGFTETAEVWKPLTEALFNDPWLRYGVKRVIALDLPGHGDSETPVGLPGALFGELTLYDNVSVVIQAIDTLRAQGLGPRVLFGHSMGGLAVQAVQEALLQQGSSLADHGVYRAVLLAPVPEGGSQWTQPAPSDLSPFLVTDDLALGPYLDLPPEIAIIGGGFTTTAGTLVSGTPTAAEMAPYVGLEPLITTLQLVGQIPELPRPSAREGAFAPIKGTLLSVVGFSEDVLVPADDLDDLYEHLIGRRGFLFRRVEGDEAVHNMYITDPEGLIETLKTLPFTF